jgi:hypothetical protein
MRATCPAHLIRHLNHSENRKFLLCVDGQEIVSMNLLHETSFMQLDSSLFEQL